MAIFAAKSHWGLCGFLGELAIRAEQLVYTGIALPAVLVSQASSPQGRRRRPE
jgi:hypothetical protein